MSIANTNAVAKIAAVAAGLGLVFASFAPVTRAQSTSDLQAQIAALLAQINSLQAQLGTTQSASVMFTTDLTIGSTGTQVTALQNWLISKGYSIPAGATGYFGAQTQSALAAYQAASGITPAAGFFGPITRAKVNASSTTTTTTTTTTTGGTTTTTTSLKGGEADLTNFDLRNEDGTVSESQQDAKLATAKFDVDGGDVNVQRAELEFKPSTVNGSINSKPWQFFDKVTVWDGSKQVGSADASSRDDWDDNGSGSSETYTIHIDNISDMVKDGDTANLTFAADVSDGIDTSDQAQKFAIDVPDQGIRAVDATGIQQYVGQDTDTVNISFENQQNGDLSVRESSSDPDSAILVADDHDDSDTYTVFAFDIRNKDDADTLLNELTIDASTTGTTTVGAGNVINKATLTIDGEDYDADISNGSGSASTTLDFNDMNATISGNDTTTGVLKVRLAPQLGNYPATGVQLTFSLAAADVDAEGADTGDTADVSGSYTGATHHVLLAGVDVEPKSTSQVETSTQSGSNFGTYTVKFDVTAVEDDAYIDDTAGTTTTNYVADLNKGVNYAIVGGSGFTGTASVAVTSTADLVTGRYKVSEGSTETFTLSVTLDALASGTWEVDLTNVNFNNTNATANSSFTVDSGNSDFKTDPLFIPA